MIIVTMLGFILGILGIIFVIYGLVVEYAGNTFIIGCVMLAACILMLQTVKVQTTKKKLT